MRSYEEIYEREYEGMEIFERIEGIAESLEGICDALVRLIGVAQEKDDVKEEECGKDERGEVRLGVDLSEDGGVGKVGEDVIGRIFGNF